MEQERVRQEIKDYVDRVVEARGDVVSRYIPEVSDMIGRKNTPISRLDGGKITDTLYCQYSGYVSYGPNTERYGTYQFIDVGHGDFVPYLKFTDFVHQGPSSDPVLVRGVFHRGSKYSLLFSTKGVYTRSSALGWYRYEESIKTLQQQQHLVERVKESFGIEPQDYNSFCQEIISRYQMILPSDFPDFRFRNMFHTSVREGVADIQYVDIEPEVV